MEQETERKFAMGKHSHFIIIVVFKKRCSDKRKERQQASNHKPRAWWEAVKGEMQQGSSAQSQDLSLISSFLKLHSHVQPTICFELDRHNEKYSAWEEQQTSLSKITQ